MKVFIGTDPKDELAYNVLVKSIHATTKEKVEIIPVRDHLLRWEKKYWRAYFVEGNGQMFDERTGTPFSTMFSFTRFCVPMMNDYRDEWVLFMDADMMLRADIGELFDWGDKSKAVNVVKHNHNPEEKTKMGGLLQTSYARKNWSSLMLMNTARCENLNQYNVNNRDGGYLHGLLWVDDDMIGELPECWNWLEGHSDPSIIPTNVHFTRGTPDMPGCRNVAYADEWLEYAKK